MEHYKMIFKPQTAELVEKKSRFIANITPVETEAEALSFVDEKKKRYWDASHNCHAFVIGERNQTERCSDDGEPSQTAGRPMLDVLLGEGIHNACVVVTRYFGGTLLGTGGLVRAYSGAVQNVLKDSLIVEKCPGEEIWIGTNYESIGTIQYMTGQMGIREWKSEYTDRVALTYIVPAELVDGLLNKVTEATSGKAEIRRVKELYFGMVDKKMHIFP